MNVRARLLLFGVLLPAIVFVVALVVSSWMFRNELLASVDRELRARAAVESVGAFDRPGDEPHLHLGRATFPPSFVELDPRGAFFSESGQLVASDPVVGAGLELGPHRATDVLGRPTTWTSDDEERRELAVGVRSPSGHLYLLRLSCSLGPLKQTVAAYVRTTTIVLALVVAALVLLWLWLAGSLSRRLESIAKKLPSSGAPSRWMPPPVVRDEIDALDRVLADSFERLARARDTEEEFLARAAHELRTPLGIMLAELDLALRRPRDESELREALVSARHEVARLSTLANKLLALTAAKRVASDETEVDLGEIVDDSLRAFEVTREQKSIRIVRDIAVGASVRAQASELRQAIDNLVANALRHAPDAGEIGVRVERVGNDVLLCVQDDGPGIAADELERVFEPFFRSKSTTGAGAGLGLAIAKAVVERSGGELRASNIAPHGARFEARWKDAASR